MGWLITPADIPATKRCFKLSIPDNEEIIAAVLGSLDELGRDSTWVQTDVANVSRAEIAEAMRDMTGEMIESECEIVEYPKRLLQIAYQYSGYGGVGTPAFAHDANQNLGFYLTRTGGNAVGDSFQFKFVLGAGTYGVFILTIKGSSGGQLNLIANGENLGTYDLYNATTLYNTQLGWSGLDVVTPGEILLNFNVVGKNAAASTYAATITAVWIEKL